MLEPDRPRLHPRPREVRVAAVGQEVLRIRAERDREARQILDLGELPRLRSVRDVPVGEEDDGRHVLDRDAARLDGALERIGRRRAGDDRKPSLAVAAEDGLEQVRLLGLRRQAGRRTAALDVDDDERELDRDREPDAFLLERHPRPGGRGRAEVAREGSADRRAHGRDLVLGLQGHHAEILVRRELLEDPRGRRDRVGAEEELDPGA